MKRSKPNWKKLVDYSIKKYRKAYLMLAKYDERKKVYEENEKVVE